MKKIKYNIIFSILLLIVFTVQAEEKNRWIKMRDEAFKIAEGRKNLMT